MMSFAEVLVEDLTKLVLDTNLMNNEGAITIGLKRCYKASKLLATALKSSSSMAEKQHLSALLARIKSFTEIIKGRREIIGFGYKQNMGQQSIVLNGAIYTLHLSQE